MKNEMDWTSGGSKDRLIAFLEEMVETCDEIDCLADREIAGARLYQEVLLRINAFAEEVPDEVRQEVLRRVFDKSESVPTMASPPASN
tara:strand:- start:548 stop:811 length:264 start_codon:yes stop_codon:yes gene_type:complete